MPDTVPPEIIIQPPKLDPSDTIRVLENRPLQVALVTNEPATWSIIEGPNAADFELAGLLTLARRGAFLQFKGNGTRDFEKGPNTLKVTLEAKDRRNNRSTRDITITVTNDVADDNPTPPPPPPEEPIPHPQDPPPPVTPPPPPPPVQPGSYPPTVALYPWAKAVWDLPKLWKPPTPTIVPNSTNIPSDCQIRNNELSVWKDGFVFDGWDFSKAKLGVRLEAQGVLFKNCLFGGDGVHVPLWVGRYWPGACTLDQCEINGAGIQRLFAGMVQIGISKVDSSLIVKNSRIWNAPQVTGSYSGNATFDRVWFGSPGVNGPEGLHCSNGHHHGGTHKYTNCLFDARDGWGKMPTNSWTAFLYWEPFSTANNVDGGAENCIFVNPPNEAANKAYYMLMTTDKNANTTRGLVVRNNIIQAGAGGKHFYPIWGPHFKELRNNLDFTSGQKITDPAEI